VKAAALALVAISLGLSTTSATAASDALPSVDLAIVSKTADVSRAHTGQLVRYTIVATNLGPDTTPTLFVFDFVDFHASGFHLVEETCDQGISADTPACEYTNVAPGETVTTIVTVRVLKHRKGRYRNAKTASNQACVTANGDATDLNPTNDCLTVTLPITRHRLVG
jgi:uncharacterized repeat protein (TIGR01451 family)